ncbi:5,6-dimethylbenzimidazole synthase [Allosediminivita pacifica]|uniref:5,6-dimethylbenzimidazole synthase n=1 Tax=Allosediminivita pacifica TaxID=1267769 RepID=A0A2T6ANZ9_9RHOB|nr:5,6-dimethylbenzimidazole synthase [Allosediminivita pacifica]PTX45562.1 cob(II)yrinic acid a,c-diamide reductase [Allosediminivita pacifica]GGB20414.1 5,6-dimethylbenzimidazole synthase [Allosediminivita pacifica]
MPDPSTCAPQPARIFTEAERQALYNVIANRRDVRNEFLPDPIAPEVLTRILRAAHMAPSVGLSQPWDFLLIRDPARRTQVRAAFTRANDEATEMAPPEKRGTYAALKLEGIDKAPLNICVTCDRSRGGDFVLGRTHQPDMDLYSTVCAVQTLWLAARAEGIGMGWVSILREEDLREILLLPAHVTPVAYLCLGHVKDLFDGPELAHRGWASRTSLEDHIREETWD